MDWIGAVAICEASASVVHGQALPWLTLWSRQRQEQDSPSADTVCLPSLSSLYTVHNHKMDYSSSRQQKHTTAIYNLQRIQCDECDCGTHLRAEQYVLLSSLISVKTKQTKEQCHLTTHVLLRVYCYIIRHDTTGGRGDLSQTELKELLIARRTMI